MIEAVACASEEGSVTEDLRMIVSDRGQVRREEHCIAHVYARRSHPGRGGGQLDVDAWDGKVNRNSQIVKSVDRLAHSCRGFDWCGQGSSCALEKRVEVEDKKFMRGSLDHILCMHNF